MDALKIVGARVFDGDSLVEKDLFVSDGRLVGEAPLGEARTIDASDCYAIPGLVDVHSHGAVGHDFCDGTHEAIDAICR